MSKNEKFRSRGVRTLVVVALCGMGLAATGCTGISRVGFDAAGAAAGGYAGHQLSDGDPLMTAAGAAGGVVLSEGLQYMAQKGQEKAYKRGYEKGRAETARRQYEIIQNLQKAEETKAESKDTRTVFYEFPAPTQAADGTKLVPHPVVVPVEE